MAAPLSNQNNVVSAPLPLPGPPVPPPLGAVPIQTPAPLPHGVTVLSAITVAPPPVPNSMLRLHPTPPPAEELKESISALNENKGTAADRNDDIVYGYIRRNYTDTNNIFPTEIIKMIIFFYDDGFFWHFSHEEIQLFRHMETLLSVPVIVQNTVFHYELQFDPNCIFFCLKMQSMPKDIEYMMIYFELHVVETDHYHKNTNLFGTFMPINERKYVIAKTKDLDLFQSMTLRGTMDVLHVRYRTNDSLNADPRFMNLTKMRANCTYEWKVSAVQLKTVRVPRIGEMRTTPFLYSPSFNRDVFSLYIERTPTFESSYISSNFRIGVKMYKLPNAVKRLLVFIIMKINHKTHSRTAKISSGSAWKYGINIPKSEKGDIECKISIKTKKAFNYEDKEIPMDDWKKYGIL